MLSLFAAVIASMTCVVHEGGSPIRHDLTFYSPAPRTVLVTDTVSQPHDVVPYRTTYRVVSGNQGGLVAIRQDGDGGFSMLSVDRNRAFGQTTASNGRTFTISGECRVRKAAR
jgi:hypothetical protein